MASRRRRCACVCAISRRARTRIYTTEETEIMNPIHPSQTKPNQDIRWENSTRCWLIRFQTTFNPFLIISFSSREEAPFHAGIGVFCLLSVWSIYFTRLSRRVVSPGRNKGHPDPESNWHKSNPMLYWKSWQGTASWRLKYYNCTLNWVDGFKFVDNWDEFSVRISGGDFG